MTHNPLPLLPLLLDDVPPGLRLALAQEGVPFCSRSIEPSAGQFVLFDSRVGLSWPPGYGQVAIDIDRLRQGWDNDPLETFLDERRQLHQWEIAGLTVEEEIAQVDRCTLRRQILEPLRAAIEQAGGIWLCVAAFPFPYRSALNFRIDHERFDPHDFDAVLQVIAGNEDATSHYVAGAAFELHGDALGRLQGFDVGTHGYRYQTHRSEIENLDNIRRGQSALRAAGIEPSGYAAPRGKYHRSVLSALETLEIDYSSGFSLARDERPFFPRDSMVLEIPIHPLSLGGFLRAAQWETARPAVTQQAVRAAVDYFRQTARSKYHGGEPVFFYGEPAGGLGRFPQVLRALFDTAEAFAAIWKTTLREFAAWWRVRSAVRLSVTVHEGQFVATANDLPEEYRIGVEYWRGRHVARLPLEGRVLCFSPASLAYENRPAPSAACPVRIDSLRKPRRPTVRNTVSQTGATIEDPRVGNWGKWARRTLRRLGH